MSLIGRGTRGAKESHGEQTRGKTDGKDKTLSMEIDQVDHVKRDLTINQKISRKFRSKKIIYSKTGGHVLTPFFGKMGQKG
jgi:hypothetical protein